MNTPGSKRGDNRKIRAKGRSTPARGKDNVGLSQDTCMFCGAGNLANDDALDLHYWQECPLLSSCPSCGQVVEISAFPDHLLSLPS